MRVSAVTIPYAVKLKPYGAKDRADIIVAITVIHLHVTNASHESKKPPEQTTLMSK